ncbi:MAG: YbbR-like domain-containing protein [Prevotella sp.]|nr:YbbR-like domain-containing protein [Prevotella sp.]
MNIRGIGRFIRLFLFSRGNKEFLIFLFFLALSGAFWLSLTLNDTYEQEFAIPVAVVDVPKNAVLTSDEVDTVKMTIRDKGIFLISYYYGDYLKNIRIHFRSHSHNNGTGTIAAQELQKIVYSRLFSSSKILSTKPDKLEFYYSYGTKKKVPVRWSGRVIPEELYFISRVEYSPDSVTIYASEEKLDSINMVYTEQLNYANFRDTLSVYCRLSKIKSVKMVPDHVQVNFFTDVLTEERIEGIPVQGINMPEGKTLRTFPAKVAVNFVTGVNVYRNLRPQDFTVVVDYNDIKKNLSEKCDIHLKDVPSGISRARLEITQVDYLIESQE